MSALADLVQVPVLLLYEFQVAVLCGSTCSQVAVVTAVHLCAALQ
jgi:hypothetical protein